MRHDWVFDVLSDLHSYATRNNLPGLAEKVEEAVREARREVSDVGNATPVPISRACRRAH